MKRSTRLLGVTALLSLLFALLLAGGLFALRLHDLKANQRAICKVQGITTAGIMANLGLALQEADFLKVNAHDLKIRAYYKAVAPALRATLDATFAKPPKCGEKFEFRIEIEGEKPRHVIVQPGGEVIHPAPAP